MLFNSISFALFLPVVFLIYWFVTKKSLIQKNFFLVVASYFFYASWDWRFLFLLVFSTLLDFFSGSKISYSKNLQKKRLWLWLSIIVNLGVLVVFKYYNFFITSFTGFLSLLGIKASAGTLNIILPVGISFYTFHGLSYVFDIYRCKIKPEKNFINYALFVSFFPLLVAGPIERATHLLPQIVRNREFDYTKAADGLRQILWGLFKKIVIADNCAVYADIIFDNSDSFSGSTLLFGAFFFAFQIYADFSGYSDIALGTARLFGFELFRNFSFPYFSRDIAEFWRRWHISLSSWFRDYLYIPLGGSKGSTWLKIRNIFTVFIISALWHGANWTFIFWGIINALYFIPLFLKRKHRDHINIVAYGRKLPSARELILMFLTFGMTIFAWIFFRAENIAHAFSYISQIFSFSLFQLPAFYDVHGVIVIYVLIVIFIIIEWNGRESLYAIAQLGIRWKRPIRYAMYYIMILAIFWFGRKEYQFIYFQF